MRKDILLTFIRGSHQSGFIFWMSDKSLILSMMLVSLLSSQFICLSLSAIKTLGLHIHMTVWIISFSDLYDSRIFNMSACLPLGRERRIADFLTWPYTFYLLNIIWLARDWRCKRQIFIFNESLRRVLNMSFPLIFIFKVSRWIWLK